MSEYWDGISVGSSQDHTVTAIREGTCPGCGHPTESTLTEVHVHVHAGPEEKRKIWYCKNCRKRWGVNPVTQDSGWWPEDDPVPGWMGLR